mmetsp:Transcript_6474/g.19578  ORF Transcript_6474/g.19578 Transcript_6474/m.19578 type:complete len:224 (-) Transcript_6474:346-1017(-)
MRRAGRGASSSRRHPIDAALCRQTCAVVCARNDPALPLRPGCWSRSATSSARPLGSCKATPCRLHRSRNRCAGSSSCCRSSTPTALGKSGSAIDADIYSRHACAPIHSASASYVGAIAVYRPSLPRYAQLPKGQARCCASPSFSPRVDCRRHFDGCARSRRDDSIGRETADCKKSGTAACRRTYFAKACSRCCRSWVPADAKSGRHSHSSCVSSTCVPPFLRC